MNRYNVDNIIKLIVILFALSFGLILVGKLLGFALKLIFPILMIYITVRVIENWRIQRR
ncbi:hypothetical protein [Vagococcus zengguangii]|uniref:hypothetical protein n=1 Tax=Vagococcus zengguangii TaxID=2571750 RepID=UPI0012AFD817|nr:hypothetical protein [Vagococcus zengguangii]